MIKKSDRPRTIRGAILGASIASVLVILGGAVWGAIVKPAPCGAGPSPMGAESAVLGMIVFTLLSPMGAVFGAIIGAGIASANLGRATFAFSRMTVKLRRFFSL